MTYHPSFIKTDAPTCPLLLLVDDNGAVVVRVPVPHDLIVALVNALEAGGAKAERVPPELHVLAAREIRTRSRPVGSPVARNLTAALAVLESA